MMDWYRWYPSLFEADTMHLTTEEVGAYKLLIDRYMTTRQPLLDNDQALANISRLPLERWLNVSSNLRSFFTSEDGRLHQKRCDIELDRQDGSTKQLSDAGKKSAEKRRRKPSVLPTEAPTAVRTAVRTEVPTDLLTAVATEETERRREERIIPPTAAEPDGTAPVAQHAKQEDDSIGRTVFNLGSVWLAKKTRRSEGACRSLIGKWVQKYDKKPVFDVLAAAELEDPVEPIEWITAALAKRAERGNGRGNGFRSGNGAAPVDDDAAAKARARIEGMLKSPLVLSSEVTRLRSALAHGAPPDEALHVVKLCDQIERSGRRLGDDGKILVSDAERRRLRERFKSQGAIQGSPPEGFAEFLAGENVHPTERAPA